MKNNGLYEIIDVLDEGCEGCNQKLPCISSHDPRGSFLNYTKTLYETMNRIGEVPFNEYGPTLKEFCDAVEMQSTALKNAFYCAIRRLEVIDRGYTLDEHAEEFLKKLVNISESAERCGKLPEKKAARNMQKLVPYSHALIKMLEDLTV